MAFGQAVRTVVRITANGHSQHQRTGKCAAGLYVVPRVKREYHSIKVPIQSHRKPEPVEIISPHGSDRPYIYVVWP